MYLFLDFEGFSSCRSLMNDELHECGELSDLLRKLYHNYEIELDGRVDVTLRLYKRISELEEKMQKRQNELSRIVEELADTYAECDRLITEVRKTVRHTQEIR